MRKNTSLIFLILLSVIFTACVTSPDAAKIKEPSGMVFGQMISSQSKDNLIEITIINFDTKKKINCRVLDNGIFYIENLSPGRYYLNNVTIRTYFLLKRSDGVLTFVSSEDLRKASPEFPGNSSDYFFTIRDNKDLVYLGQYYLEASESFLGYSFEYNVVKRRDVSEKVLLDAILPYTEGSGWDRIIKEKRSKSTGSL
jgi:hypothetical protein